MKRTALANALVLLVLLAVNTSQAARVWRIDYLSPGSVGVFGSFRLAPRELGYIEDENLLIESRLAKDEGRLREPRPSWSVFQSMSSSRGTQPGPWQRSKPRRAFRSSWCSVPIRSQ